MSGYKKPGEISLSDLKRVLRAAGAQQVREGSDHEVWERQVNDKVAIAPIQRHRRPLDSSMAETIAGQLGISKKDFWRLYFNG